MRLYCRRHPPRSIRRQSEAPAQKLALRLWRPSCKQKPAGKGAPPILVHGFHPAPQGIRTPVRLLEEPDFPFARRPPRGKSARQTSGTAGAQRSGQGNGTPARLAGCPFVPLALAEDAQKNESGIILSKARARGNGTPCLFLLAHLVVLRLGGEQPGIEAVFVLH